MFVACEGLRDIQTAGALVLYAGQVAYPQPEKADIRGQRRELGFPTGVGGSLIFSVRLSVSCGGGACGLDACAYVPRRERLRSRITRSMPCNSAINAAA